MTDETTWTSNSPKDGNHTVGYSVILVTGECDFSHRIECDFSLSRLV